MLADAAVVESRGGAQTWRFTPASVRAALDAGWDADDLLGQLRTVAEHALPQALEYLVGDVARRHGQVRVRGVRCCVVADEALATEILHTRSLAKLHLRQLAPTVLASSAEPAAVLAKLRDAGMYPVAENPDGTVAVERRAVHR
nr:helicase-associated domain-containing protein [Micromonospora sp. DSM 115978]